MCRGYTQPLSVDIPHHGRMRNSLRFLPLPPKPVFRTAELRNPILFIALDILSVFHHTCILLLPAFDHLRHETDMDRMAGPLRERDRRQPNDATSSSYLLCTVLYIMYL
jgi:hypothetical protein